MEAWHGTNLFTDANIFFTRQSRSQTKASLRPLDCYDVMTKYTVGNVAVGSVRGMRGMHNETCWEMPK